MNDMWQQSPAGKTMQKLQNMRKTVDADINSKAEYIQYKLQELIPQSERKAWTKHILDTDMWAIRDMSQQDAEKYLEGYKDSLAPAEKYIEQSIKALNHKEHQVGYFRNNGGVIAKEVGLSPDFGSVIDKVISIRAMKQQDWDFKQNNQSGEAFQTVMAMIGEERISAQKLFGSNPDSFVKGNTKEHYTGLKKIESATPEERKALQSKYDAMSDSEKLDSGIVLNNDGSVNLKK